MDSNYESFFKESLWHFWSFALGQALGCEGYTCFMLWAAGPCLCHQKESSTLALSAIHSIVFECDYVLDLTGI